MYTSIAVISTPFYSPASRRIGGGARLGASHIEACQLEFTPVMNLHTLHVLQHTVKRALERAGGTHSTIYGVTSGSSA